jgi:hypothetical protein
MAIMAIALSLAGARIGAGIGRLELNEAVSAVQRYVQIARLQAQRSDHEQYVLLDRQRHSVALLSPEMKVVREEKLPGSVEVVLAPDVQAAAVYIAPSGIVRGEAVRLRGRTGVVEVALK